MTNIQALTITKYQSNWIGLALSYSSNKLFKIEFPDAGSINTVVSYASSPVNISYSKGGLKKITLTAYNVNNEYSTQTHPVFVRPEPIADFINLGTPPVFKAVRAPGEKMIAWNWDFGDGTTGEGAMVEHVFRSDGTYSVRLSVQSACGESSSITKKVSIKGNTVLQCPEISFASSRYYMHK
jgi:PKD repeat protein